MLNDSITSLARSRAIEILSEEKILVRWFYEEIITKARFDKLGEILSSEIVWHDP